MPEPFANVRVKAVDVHCHLCGQRARIGVNTGDAFTRQVLTPMAAWWEAHRAPHLIGLLLDVDGFVEQWVNTH